MKTAEEEARDFLTGEGAKYPLPKAVSIFANAKAKALLEEAAEMPEKFEHYKDAKKAILSLIPKEQ